MRLIFAGTPEVAARSLELVARRHEVALVLTRPDAPTGRKRTMTPSPVAQKAGDLGLAVRKTNRIDDETLALIQEAKAEKAIVVAFGAMIPEAALSRISWWNLHFSVLPEWRGSTPLQHSMMHDTGIGVSVFLLDQSLDTGMIIAQEPLSFLKEETAGQALKRFTDIGSSVLLDALEKEPEPMQQIGISSSAPKLTRPDAKINFGKSASELQRFIRATNPEPMAWTNQDGEPVRILGASNPDSQPDFDTTRDIGQIFKAGNNEIFVQCGDSSFLKLEIVQPAGKRETKASDWWNGLKGRTNFD